jgi:membrane protein implicated in regulation of membrane protease activity
VAQRAPLRPTSRIEEAIGFVGCFGLLFLAVTVFCELTGRPALGWALTLLAAVVAIVLLDRWRRRVLHRTADVAGRDHTPPATRASGR